MVVHSHKSSVLVRLGIGIPLLQRFQMAVIFLQFVPVFFQFLQLFAFLFQFSLFLFRGWLGNLFQCMTQFSCHFQSAWPE